jgi:hypothetical protein
MDNNTKHNEIENTQEEDSFLTRIPKKNNFKIPENYFDNLNKEITNKIQNSTTQKVISIQSKNSKRPLLFGLLAAAAAILLIVIFTTPEKEQTIAGIPNTLEEPVQEPITIDMIEVAVEENLSQVDTLLVASLENEIPIENTPADYTINELEDLFSDENFY